MGNDALKINGETYFKGNQAYSLRRVDIHITYPIYVYMKNN